ncbi:phosphoglycerate dehydrogenase-like enzyme [Streptohalobacillus salinus]|uniref:Phosphoglycerate dehydrogenase-like enzyme n=2 Tax=Streptohalobacillus salinus TaxID=621096 RepID=A0A2V3W4P5_9BACI|nr:phosphoglycerate dehydrogenase-like enzyme [Streptohalobacillus salinus]
MIVVSATHFSETIEQQLIERYPAISFYFYHSIEEAVNLNKAEVLLTYGEDLTSEHINQAKALKWIMVLSAGIEELPFEAIIEREIQVTNARGIHKKPMAEYALGMLLAQYRNVYQFDKQQQNKVWNQKLPTREINQRVLTVVGAGAIGEELARICRIFDIETRAVSRTGEDKPYFDKSYSQSELITALRGADFVVSILPSVAETRPFYHKEAFKAMKRDAIFLNMGRGDAVETEVLLDALNEGEIEHAILDVLPEEPLPVEHPFWMHDKITITPHISGKSKMYVPRALSIFEENLSGYLVDGSLPVNQINPKRGY